MTFKFYPKLDEHGVPNEMACTDCARAGFGIASVVTQSDQGEFLDEFCVDCASKRYPHVVTQIDGYWTLCSA